VAFLGDKVTKLTPYAELRPGLWFVRSKRKKDDIPDVWGIALIGGEYPFLFGRIYFYSDDLEMKNIDRMLKFSGEIAYPRDWEFGPQILFPVEDENE
jgi:hypothetical protein